MTETKTLTEHSHKWDDGATYKHTHKRGNVPHEHHGSRMDKEIENVKHECKTCDAEWNAGEDIYRCPNCESVNTITYTDKEKIDPK